MEVTSSPASSADVSRSGDTPTLLFYAITIFSLTTSSPVRYPCASARACVCLWSCVFMFVCLWGWVGGALKPRKEFHESWYEDYVPEGEETKPFYRFVPIPCYSVCMFDSIRLPRKIQIKIYIFFPNHCQSVCKYLHCYFFDMFRLIIIIIIIIINNHLQGNWHSTTGCRLYRQLYLVMH
jgi:hypothetical protein